MIIQVKVKPQSKKEYIERISDKKYQVCLHEAPEKGKANKALVKLLADYFSISLSKVVIVKGQKSKDKIVNIEK